MPEEPEIQVCTPELILNQDNTIDYSQSKVFCVSSQYPDDISKHHWFDISEFIIKRPVLAEVQDYAEIIKWSEQVKLWSKKHCK